MVLWFQGKKNNGATKLKCVGDEQYSTLAQYCIDFTFTLVIITFLWNLFLICRIQFSRVIIVTRLTFQPYLFALAFLSVLFVECLALMVSQVNSGDTP